MSPSLLPPGKQVALVDQLERIRLVDLRNGEHRPYVTCTPTDENEFHATCPTCQTSGPMRPNDKELAVSDGWLHLKSRGQWPSPE